MRIPQIATRVVAWSQEHPRGISLCARVLRHVFGIWGRLSRREGLLLVFTGASGDLVSLCPVLRKLARQHPHPPLDILVKGKGTGSILKACPYVDRVMEFAASEDTACKW